MSISIYTDGSAPNNHEGGGNPAGWGYVVVSGVTGKNHDGGELVEEQYGRVITDRNHPMWIGAEIGTNNTAELCAIYHALEYIKDNDLTGAIIYTDSTYAMNLTFGTWKAGANRGLVRKVKGLATELHGRVIAEHVRAHQDLLWNERADELANKGARL